MLTAGRHSPPEGHTLHIYGSDRERFDTAAAWTDAGVVRGERVVHTVTSDQDQRQLLAALVDRFDAERPLATGQLTVWSLHDLYPLKPARLLALGEGYSGLRVSGPTNVAVNRLTVPDYTTYEAGVNQLCRERSIGALCQYDLRRSPVSGMRMALRPHDRVQDSTAVLCTSVESPSSQVTVDVSGDLDAANAELLSLVLQRAVQQTGVPGTLLLQCRELDELSVAAVRAIVGGTRAWRTAGGKVRLKGLSGFTFALLQLSGMRRLPGIRIETAR